MKVTMFWHGGSSYACFDTHSKRDAEQYNSLKDAISAFAGRSNGQDSYYPCVSEDSPENGGPEAWVFIGANVIGADYPDRILRFGRRGGVICERA